MENEKIILDIVVDVQKDFITGALVNAEAQANVAHLAEVARAHAQAGHWMFFTKDTHPEEYLDTREGRRLPVEHCIEGTDGWNFAPELEDAMDFVLKPVSYYQFSTKLERALQRIQRRRGGQIALQVGGGVQLLNTDDILYLETRDRLLHYHTAADTWSVRGSLQKAEKELAPYHFARCNQCYLVNLRHVTGVQNDFVQIGQEQLEISRRQRVAFLAAVAAYVGGAL